MPSAIVCASYLLPRVKFTTSLREIPRMPRNFYPQPHRQVALPHPYLYLPNVSLPRPVFWNPWKEGSTIHAHTTSAYRLVFSVFFFLRLILSSFGFSFLVTYFQPYKMMGSGCSPHTYYFFYTYSVPPVWTWF